jgi:putative spermidine/putrescine transport system permease protein
MEHHVSHRRRAWLYLLSGLILGFLLLPTLIVIPMSFSASDALQFPPRGFSMRWYQAYLSSPEWRDATLVSLKVSLITMLLATPIGTAAAYGLHFGRFRLAILVHGALVAALMVPVILIAIAVFFLYARLGLVNTTLGLVLADTLLAVPFVLIIVTAGLKSFDGNQELVARSLGAGRLRAFPGVTLPQIWRSVLSGALFAFIAAFDEVVIATMISGGEGATLTNRMFSSLRDEVDPTIAAISSLLIAVTTIPPLIGHLISARRDRRPNIEPSGGKL